MIPVKFYAYVQFYSIHAFRGSPQMLMYSSYRRTKVHDELVENLRPHIDEFQDITVLKHLCAKVTDYDRKVYFVNASEVMEKRLRKALR